MADGWLKCFDHVGLEDRVIVQRDVGRFVDDSANTVSGVGDHRWVADVVI